MQSCIGKTIIALAFLSYLTACSSTAEDIPIELPRIESAYFTTVDKPKTDLSTPNGTKQIYDPLQDPDVMLAFEGFVQAKRQSGYFKGLPRNLVKRWNQRSDAKSRVI